ncbi:MAG TPA: hypothetical protein VK116_15200 [Planctomycetota bacterium]|nr:hypothetical protein [Planctomycetota bacterium]
MTTRITLTAIASLFSVALLGSGDSTERTTSPGAGEPTVEIYGVWKSAQRIYVKPRQLGPYTLVPRGTQLVVLDRRREWAEVEWGPAGKRKTGWAQLTPPQVSAGEKAESLSNTTMSTIVMAAKALLDEIEKADAAGKEIFPEANANFEALEAAEIEEDELASFLREGGLRLPGGN